MLVLSIDIPTKSFRTLEITDTNVTKWGVELEYSENDKECLAPMFVMKDDYKKLLTGHIIELHHGQVALVKIY